jgi:hypothetical protein
VHTLVQKVLALGTIDDVEVALQCAALDVRHLLENDVLAELNVDDVAGSVFLYGCH